MIASLARIPRAEDAARGSSYMAMLYGAYRRGHQIYIDETKKYLLAFKITSRDVCATSTCLKLNYLKIIGLNPTVLKKSNLLRDRITNYICYLKI